ncbi:hypothetical protein Desor_3896 [Desulfosporosinus orientis DSM 765]|uniref:Helix-turn-helix protein n=1 Tax=Desulfosporosinus orientis (strain ATCC 19365 / DSM 765 / NCIMB 8382 / VKM B-1628 / Singapore I) TaxID=768706 RepID=G7WBU6_DESOD|nr:helix-turn-helix domain-containing protein [Desulfosporosinus orientis]AET69343.1 hypothetical protein Desor_3896 [Desulfosporosinus orientis DSM 765]
MDIIEQQLRMARETKGLELKEIEEITKIPSKYLQALEEGDFCVLPGGVYTVGFLRSYARFLDLDAESIVNAFRSGINSMKLTTKFDNTTKEEIIKSRQDQSLINIILQLYREVATIFKFRINNMGSRKDKLQV